MIRVAACVVGLSTWLSVALGLRAWLGGQEYLRALLGSEALADEAMARVLSAMPEATLLMGMDPWLLLLAFSVVVSAALVLVVLWPWDLLMRRMGLGLRGRAAGAVGVAAATTGVILSSIHPVLAMPSVPEGPRTVLNFACEAAGYGWVNAIAYIGALATGLAFAWLGARSQVSDEATASPAEADAGTGDAEPGANDRSPDPDDDPDPALPVDGA